MIHCHKVLICLTLSLCATAALAQEEALHPEAATSPVAYVYVSRPTHIDGFAASSSGKLTPVPGSPYAGISFNNMVIAGKYLYGTANQFDFASFSIAANGSLKPAAVTNVGKYLNGCGGNGTLQTDLAGQTIYNQFDLSLCDVNNAFESFKTEGKGELQFRGNTTTGIAVEAGTLPLVFSGGNRFAYQTSCGNDGHGGASTLTEIYREESKGLLVKAGFDNLVPAAKVSGDIYCSQYLASDARGHLAYALQEYDPGRGENTGPVVLASYTANSTGALSTHSTYANMPSTVISFVYTMSISPSGKLLAVGGENGFELFHFNGGGPVTHGSGLIPSDLGAYQFAWDGDDHLYVVGYRELYVYTVTPTSIKQAPGSPYSIPDAGNVSVLSLK